MEKNIRRSGNLGQASSYSPDSGCKHRDTFISKKYMKLPAVEFAIKSDMIDLEKEAKIIVSKHKKVFEELSKL